MKEDSAKSTEAVKSLAGRLARVQQIARLSDNAHDEPWVLAQSLFDLAEASRSYLETWPALLNPELESNELIHALLERSIDLQHMLYHLEEPRFLRQLFTPLRDEWSKARSG